VTWLMLWLIAGRLRGWHAVGLAVFLSVLLAFGTEAMQLVTGRDAQLSDALRDLLGASAAVAAWCARKRLVAAQLAYPLAGLLLLGSMAPLFQALATEARRVNIAPDLVRFDSTIDRALFGSNSVVEVVPGPDGKVAHALKITLADETWPGIHLDEPMADWRGYRALAVDLYVEGDEPLPVTLSVRLDNAPVDHVYRTFDCAPGPCSIRLPLAGLFDADVARVNAVVIYSVRAFAGRTMYLYRVALQRG
jgi:hypothetical protein